MKSGIFVESSVDLKGSLSNLVMKFWISVRREFKFSPKIIGALLGFSLMGSGRINNGIYE